MKHSIRIKITMMLTAAIVAVIMLTWLFNRALLERYYTYTKTDSLRDAYTLVLSELDKSNRAQQDLETDDSTEPIPFPLELKTKLDSLSIRNNLTLVISTQTEGTYISRIEGNSKEYFLKRMQNYLLHGGKLIGGDIKRVVYDGEKYDIYRVNDAQTKSEYIELISANADTGRYILIRTNLESIQEAVAIANKFLAYVGIITTIVVSLIMLEVSKSFTDPIRRLSVIAKSMTNLNFNIKYPLTSQDEIGELGRSINLLSEKLEMTISELKNANNELLSDIEKKTQIDEMRKEFLSNVSHELKTPISLIQGYAEGLKENVNEDAENRDFYCDVIMDEASKMNKMVKKLLTLNQIEFGNNVMDIARFDIVALIKSVLHSTEILKEKKGINILFTSQEPVDVWADEYMIEEVFTNYISNALHHVSGENVIEVKLDRHEDILRVSVFNTGERIPESDIDKIWIKFYKVDKARTREYGGSGIGLSIVKAIMDQHHKECGVMNHSNGVEFWFELDTKA